MSDRLYPWWKPLAEAAGYAVFYWGACRVFGTKKTVSLEPQGNWTVQRRNWILWSEVTVTQNDGQLLYTNQHISPLRLLIHGREF